MVTKEHLNFPSPLYLANLAPLGVNHISILICIASQRRKEHDPPPPAICIISRFSTKLVVFQKNFECL